MKKLEDKFEQNIRQILDQSVEELDAETLGKISQTKYRAMEKVQQKKAWRPAWILAPALATLLFVVLLNSLDQQSLPVAQPELTALAILTSTEPLDFYAEDIEFYQWLSEIMATEGDPRDDRSALPVDSQPIAMPGRGGDATLFSERGTARIHRLFRG